MKIKRALPILWLPLIGFWTFLFAVQLNTTSTDLEGIVPLIAYLLTSFLLVLQLQLLIGTKREGVLVKLGTSYVLLTCLLTSSISILLSIFQTIENQLAIILVVVPLIINTINAEVFSVSNKQIVKKKKAWENTSRELEESQNKSLEEVSKARNVSIQTREDWKKYLKQASIDYMNNREILDEINRIKDILQFSSYFRTEESSETLNNLQEGLNNDDLIQILREIK